MRSEGARGSEEGEDDSDKEQLHDAKCVSKERMPSPKLLLLWDLNRARGVDISS